MRNQSENSLGDIIRQFANENKLQDRLNQVSLPALWADLVGPVISKKTKELRLQDGILRIRIESATIRQELDYQKPIIIQKLNDGLGQPVIKDVILC
jgi:predicted nucleic acid-binding Zn ribbon protein